MNIRFFLFKFLNRIWPMKSLACSYQETDIYIIIVFCNYLTYRMIRFWSTHNLILYKIKNCKNNCKMWHIGNCFLSAPVHIPPNEIPHQTPGSHWAVFGNSGWCGIIFILSHNSRMPLGLTRSNKFWICLLEIINSLIEFPFVVRCTRKWCFFN